MIRQRYRPSYCPLAGVAAAAGLILAVAACSSGSSGGGSASSGGKVTVSIDCAPAAAQLPVQHKEWVEDVALFEKANPNITISSVYNYPCEVPATFTAMLRGGTEPDIFYSYFTDLPQVLLSGQAADIPQYVNSTTVPTLGDIVPSAMKAVTAGKTIYGLPTSNYTQGLIYNRKLFSEAGLDPNSPPTTWTQVEQDATAIAKLGNGIEGWGDYSAGNNGGWHFSSYIDAVGGSMVNNSGAAPVASFDSSGAVAILQALHKLPSVANAFNIFLLKRFFDSIPTEYIDAAQIDGASRLTILLRIVLPISRPIIGVVSIFSLVAVWKDFLWPLLVEYGYTPTRETLNVGIWQAYQGTP
jgi:ABC-type glycerol-3-phosphate transport system substrate-binding protein